MVFLPDKAIIPARFKATNVFPSPEMEEEIAITRAFELTKLRLVRIFRMDSAKMDFGLLWIINWLNSELSFNSGIFPKIVTFSGSSCFRSSMVLISLKVMYLKNKNAKPITNPINMNPAYTSLRFGLTGMEFSDASFRIRLLEVYPAFDIEYMTFFSVSSV
ncbi:hypothetical protein D3C86_1271810 [compost metagenome]